jgi:hypothetical protein
VFGTSGTLAFNAPESLATGGGDDDGDGKENGGNVTVADDDGNDDGDDNVTVGGDDVIGAATTETDVRPLVDQIDALNGWYDGGGADVWGSY